MNRTFASFGLPMLLALALGWGFLALVLITFAEAEAGSVLMRFLAHAFLGLAILAGSIPLIALLWRPLATAETYRHPGVLRLLLGALLLGGAWGTELQGSLYAGLVALALMIAMSLVLHHWEPDGAGARPRREYVPILPHPAEVLDTVRLETVVPRTEPALGSQPLTT